MIELKDKIRKIIADSGHNMYQTHTLAGEVLNTGIRGIERRAMILKCDIRRKRILDLGCATGAECVWGIEEGALAATGVDLGKKQIQLFKKIIETLDLFPKVSAICFDLLNGLPDLPFQVDTLFCFSITHHISYRKIWHEVPGVSVVYVEGGSDSNYSVENLSDDIFEAQLIGSINDSNKNADKTRPLFRLVRRAAAPQLHYWETVETLSEEAELSKCCLTNDVKIIKPRTATYDQILPIAGNEYIGYRLMMLLAVRGIDIDVAKVVLSPFRFHNHKHNICMIEYLGEHSRIDLDNCDLFYVPEWIYWFDKWIGRLDSATNLILVDNKVMPIDFAMAYHWAVGDDRYTHDMDMMNVKSHPKIKKSSTLKAKKAIESVTDQEIEDIVLSDDLEGFIPLSTRRLYLKGLIYRRDHLGAKNDTSTSLSDLKPET